MKTFLIATILLFNTSLSSQKKLPILKANSNRAYIVEGKDDRYNWSISPDVKPDVHLCTKYVKPKWIRFYTDCDSIKVKLKAGTHFDFIVVLNVKDSCYTRLEMPPLKNDAKLKPATHDTIPFVLSAFNNLIFKAIINATDTLYLKFDTGTTGLLLTRAAIKARPYLAQTGLENHILQLGHQTWKQLTVYPVELSGQGTDGRFGWDLFDGKIVEIDFDHQRFIVHSQRPKISKHYSQLPMAYTQGLMTIKGTLQIKNKRYTSHFLFDNGYQRTILLDTSLMREQNYPSNLPILKKTILKNGQGKEVPVITVNNDQLHLGKETLFNIPVQLMTGTNPARFKIHILGNEVLKRFNTFLDFQNNVVYLKSNTLTNRVYAEGS